MCVRISVSINDLFDDWQTNSRVFISSIMIKNIHLLFSSEVLVFPSFLSSSSDSFQSRLHFYIVTELLKMTLIFFSCSTAFWPCLFCRFVPRHFALVVHRTSTTYWIYIIVCACVCVRACWVLNWPHQVKVAFILRTFHLLQMVLGTRKRFVIFFFSIVHCNECS